MTKLGGFESCEYYEIQSWSKLCQRARHSCLYTTGVLLEHVFIKHHCQSLTISLPPHSCCSVWRIHLERRMRLRNLSLDNLSEVARITISLRLSQDASEPTPRIHLLAIPCESVTLYFKKNILSSIYILIHFIKENFPSPTTWSKSYMSDKGNRQ